jgi:hypothetical protein
VNCSASGGAGLKANLTCRFRSPASCGGMGEEHLRPVLSTLAETDNNKGQLGEVLVLCRVGHGARLPRNPSAGAAGMAVDVGCLPNWRAARGPRPPGVLPLRFALGGMLYERIVRAFGPRAIQPDLFDDRRRHSA